MVTGESTLHRRAATDRCTQAKPHIRSVGNATQSANLTSDQIAAIQQLRSEGELLAQNGQLGGAIDSLNTAIKMLGLKDRLYLNIPLGYTVP